MSPLKQNPALADALQELSDEYSIRVLVEAVAELAKELEESSVTDEVQKHSAWAER